MASTRSRAASVDTFHDPRKNHLLAALPPPDFAAIAASLEPVTLRLGDALYASGVPLQHAYFPGTAIVSLHYVTTSGASSETAGDRKSTRLNSSHLVISYAVFCLKKKI